MNQIYATSPADSRKGVHRAIIIFLLCISIVLSIGSIAISAAESTTYEVNLSDAKIIGTVSLSSTDYPLYSIDVNGTNYSSIHIVPNSATITALDMAWGQWQETVLT